MGKGSDVELNEEGPNGSGVRSGGVLIGLGDEGNVLFYLFYTFYFFTTNERTDERTN